MRSVVGLIGIVEIVLHITVATEKPWSSESPRAIRICFKGWVEHSLSRRRDALCTCGGARGRGRALEAC